MRGVLVADLEFLETVIQIGVLGRILLGLSRVVHHLFLTFELHELHLIVRAQALEALRAGWVVSHHCDVVLKLLVRLGQLHVHSLGLLQLGIVDRKLLIYTRDFRLFLVKNIVELLLELAFSLSLLLSHLLPQLLLILLALFDFLVEHFDVQFKLLLDLDVVANIGLIFLELLFVLFWRQIDRFEGGGEAGLIQRVTAIFLAVGRV